MGIGFQKLNNDGTALGGIRDAVEETNFAKMLRYDFDGKSVPVFKEIVVVDNLNSKKIYFDVSMYGRVYGSFAILTGKDPNLRVHYGSQNVYIQCIKVGKLASTDIYAFDYTGFFDSISVNLPDDTANRLFSAVLFGESRGPYIMVEPRVTGSALFYGSDDSLVRTVPLEAFKNFILDRTPDMKKVEITGVGSAQLIFSYNGDYISDYDFSGSEPPVAIPEDCNRFSIEF